MLELTDVTKRFGSRVVLQAVSLRVGAGEYVAVVGESGIGKSTLLNIIAGLEPADAGRVRVDGVEMSALDDDAATRLRRERFGFVFQAFHVLPHLTVLQNVGLPLLLRGRSSQRSASRDARRARHASSRAASCSAWRSPARWSAIRSWCSPTSRPATSIPRTRATCSSCCAPRSRSVALRRSW
jgi:ABC-type lipoprotein export system ATPase subunit